MKVQVVCLNRLVFLPLIHGLLRGYIEECEPALANQLEWGDPIFLDDTAENIVAKIDCDVLALSCYVWNFKKQMKIARLLREKNTQVYVVAGGPHVPNTPGNFFKEHPYVDIIVHGEGEVTFANVLKIHISEADAYPLHGTSTSDFHVPSRSLFGEKLPKDIEIDSPYQFLDSAVTEVKETGQEFWVPWETNRGCPYQCSFCLDNNAWVYTNDGVMTIEKAVSSDSVSHVWSSYGMQSIARKMKRRYRGDMIVIKVQGRQEIHCTPDHEWFTENGLKYASKIRVGDRLVLSSPSPIPKDHLSVGDILPDVQENIGWVRYSGGKNPIPKVIPLTKEFMRLCGLFIADGSVCFHKNRPNSCTVNWTFHKDQIDLQNEILSTLYSIFGLKAYLSDTNTATQVSISNSVLGNLFKSMFGDKATTKRIPHFWMNLDASLLKPLIEGYLLGDGSFHINEENSNGRWASSTVSKTLAFQLQVILNRFGKNAGVYQRKSLDEHIQRKKVCVNTSYRVEFSGQFVVDNPNQTVLVKSVKMKYYDGYVFNLETEEQPVYSVHGVESHNCDWGSSLMNKVRKFSLKRLGHDFDFFTEHQIDNVYICDANFGMLKVDEGITNALIRSKSEYGYPKQIRGSFAKNSNNRVFNITKSLMEAGMIYGTTLSMQSMDEGVLEAVDRENIGVNKYRELQEKYRAEGYHTYSELILPLPEETKDSFLDGICSLIAAGNHEDIRVWELSILPNAPMAQHVSRYGLKTVTKNVFLELPRTDTEEIETNQVVIATDTMSKDDWVDCYLFAWAIQALHCGYYTRYIAEYLNREQGVSYRKFYENLITGCMEIEDCVIGRRLHKLKKLLHSYPNHPSNHLMQKAIGFGPTRRNPADWLWLSLCGHKDVFYSRLIQYMSKHVNWSWKLDDLINFQQGIMLDPSYDPQSGNHIKVSHNWKEYFTNGEKLRHQARMYEIRQTHTGVDDKYSLINTNNVSFADAAVGTGFLVSRHRHYAHPLSEIR